jgi:hypothetical protein
MIKISRFAIDGRNNIGFILWCQPASLKNIEKKEEGRLTK